MGERECWGDCDCGSGMAWAYGSCGYGWCWNGGDGGGGCITGDAGGCCGESTTATSRWTSVRSFLNGA
eukprot:7380511-Prymnesium_polylepis.1